MDAAPACLRGRPPDRGRPHRVLLVTAAVTGMRAGELMALTTAAPLPPRAPAPGLTSYKLAGRVIKDQPYGGTPDE